MPTSADVSMALKRGSALFFSRVWISVYSTMIPVLLGLLSGPAAVGLYDLADKARTAATYVMNPVSEALFPRMSHLIYRDQREAGRLFRKSLLVTVFVAGFVSGGLFFGADWIVILLGGENFRDASSVLRYLSPLPMLVGLSNVFGVQVMIPMGRTKAFNSILATAGILALVMTFPLVKYLDAIGAAITRTLAELCVTLLMGIYIKRYQFLK
jgi:O-antigen/teichoic acid export membrane protein